MCATHAALRTLFRFSLRAQALNSEFVLQGGALRAKQMNEERHVLHLVMVRARCNALQSPAQVKLADQPAVSPTRPQDRHQSSIPSIHVSELQATTIKNIRTGPERLGAGPLPCRPLIILTPHAHAPPGPTPRVEAIPERGELRVVSELATRDSLHWKGTQDFEDSPFGTVDSVGSACPCS